MNNLSTFPFVAEAVEAGTLSLHGLFFDIHDGTLEELDGDTGSFSLL